MNSRETIVQMVQALLELDKAKTLAKAAIDTAYHEYQQETDYPRSKKALLKIATAEVAHKLGDIQKEALEVSEILEEIGLQEAKS